MKNKYMMGALLIGIISLFASCSDDNDSNPTLIQPTEFKLNTPEYANGFIDLEKSKELNFTWSQPKYTADNAPLNVTYEIQVSPKNSFTVSTDEAAADESGEKVADYDILSPKFKENEVPAELEVGIRINAYIVEGNKRLNPVISNVVTLKAKPYYIELKDATPIMWYLVGNMFGGKWGDKKASIGDQSLPMFLKPNFRYDKKTGTGEIEYTNYFTTGSYKENGDVDGSGFKIQSDFDWAHSMNAQANNPGTIVYRATEGESGHCVAPTNGYYTITLNTAKNTATMEKYEGDVTDYGTIQIAGTFNDWADTPMLPYNTEGVENHAWYYVMEVPAGETVSFKFKIADGNAWGKSWGYGATNGAINMYGKCESGGNNIGLEAGKYVISFNDITGAFSIVKL